MLKNKHSEKEFEEFIKNFNFTSLEKEKNNAENLFAILNSQEFELYKDKWAYAIEFGDIYGNEYIKKEIFCNIRNGINESVKEISIRNAERILKFLFSYTKQGDEKENIDVAYEFLFKCLDEFVFKCSEQNFLEVKSFYVINRNFNKDNINDFLVRFISQDRIEVLNNFFESASNLKSIEFYFLIILSILLELEMSWSKCINNIHISKLINIALNKLGQSPRILYSILQIASDNLEFFINLVMYCHNLNTENDINNENLVRDFMNILISKDENIVLEVRQKISKMNNGNKFIFEAFKIMLESSNDKKQFFWEYYNANFKIMKEYSEQYLPKAILIYLDTLDDKEKDYEECMNILKQFSYEINDIEILKGLVQSAEKLIPFKNVASEQLIDITCIEKIKSEKGIKTQPDIISMIKLGIKFNEMSQGKKIPDISEEIIKEKINIESISKNRYIEYLDWVLPICIPIINKIKDHKILISKLNYGKYEEEFLTEYLKYNLDVMNNYGEVGKSIFLKFIICFLQWIASSTEAENHLQFLKEVIIDEIAFRNDINEFNEYIIKSKFAAKNQNIIVKWDEMFLEIKKKSKVSFFNKIKDIFYRNAK